MHLLSTPIIMSLRYSEAFFSLLQLPPMTIGDNDDDNSVPIGFTCMALPRAFPTTQWVNADDNTHRR